MSIQRMEQVGLVVDNLAAATALFVELGIKLQGKGPVEGGWVDRVAGGLSDAAPVMLTAELAETPDDSALPDANGRIVSPAAR